MSLKLDYSLRSPEERKQLVEQILLETPNPPPQYLETLADYLVLAQERKILTENRKATIAKRETSYEGLASQFESGEDGVYNLITEDKNQIFRHKVEITAQDLEEIPFLKQLREAISTWQKLLKKRTGREAYIIKKTIIDLQKDQYLIKNAYRRPIVTMSAPPAPHWVPLEYSESVSNGTTLYSGVSLMNPKVCAKVLFNYSKLKAAGEGNFISDTWYFMEDFDAISARALASHLLYSRLLELKIDGKQNTQIQNVLETEFNVRYSAEHISTLWCKKIPKLIAQQAEEEFLDWWFLTQEKGKYKKCGKCGQIKLAHSKYFSKNNGGFYSICKKCRKKGVNRNA